MGLGSRWGPESGSGWASAAARWPQLRQHASRLSHRGCCVSSQIHNAMLQHQLRFLPVPF